MTPAGFRLVAMVVVVTAPVRIRIATSSPIVPLAHLIPLRVPPCSFAGPVTLVVARRQPERPRPRQIAASQPSLAVGIRRLQRPAAVVIDRDQSSILVGVAVLRVPHEIGRARAWPVIVVAPAARHWLADPHDAVTAAPGLRRAAFVIESVVGRGVRIGLAHGVGVVHVLVAALRRRIAHRRRGRCRQGLSHRRRGQFGGGRFCDRLGRGGGRRGQLVAGCEGERGERAAGEDEFAHD